MGLFVSPVGIGPKWVECAPDQAGFNDWSLFDWDSRIEMRQIVTESVGSKMEKRRESSDSLRPIRNIEVDSTYWGNDNEWDAMACC